MGKQIGVVRIRGTVGNLTFTKSETGEEVRLKSSLSKSKMMKNKNFKRTRENWNEFSRAGSAAKLIRNAFATTIAPISDPRGYSRLVTETLAVVKSDVTNDRGKREFPQGDLTSLINYEFNVRQALESSFKLPFDLTIDRAAGTVELAVPEMVPLTSLAYLQGATHFKLVGAAVEINWATNEYVHNATESAELVIGEQIEPAQVLNLTVPAGSTNTILVAFGIWFYQEVNGKYYLLADGGKNAMALVGVDHV